MEATLKKEALARRAVFSEDQRPSPVVEALYSDHATWLLGYLRRRYGVEAADDLTQETYLRVARLPPVGPLRDPRSYLLHIARNLAKDRSRNNRRRITETLDDDAIAAAPVHGPQLQAVLFRQIMLALPPKLRDVLVLNHVRGMTYPEIAQLLGISVKTVEKRISKAMVLCATAMCD